MRGVPDPAGIADPPQPSVPEAPPTLARRRPSLAQLRESETAKAVGLAGAMMASNVVALATTVAFGRILGVDGYGSLAALVSTFLILSVPGAALQVATARDGSLGRLGAGRDLAATIARWTRTMVLVTLALSAVAALLRAPLASAIGVEQQWAAAATIPTACLWILLSIQRGALQSQRSYAAVGISMPSEQLARLLLGVVLAVAGLGVTGAWLGTPLAMAALATILGLRLRRQLGPADPAAPEHPLRALVVAGWTAIAGLALIAILQNIDVIIAKHELSSRGAGSYASAAVAAKVVIWVAIGVGFHLLPEAARRHAAGRDARGVLGRALAVVLAVGVPCLLLYAAVPKLVLKVAFGPEYQSGSQALLLLATAMTLLAGTYLAVQLLLALHNRLFLAGLAAVALLEPVLLLTLGHGESLAAFASIVLALQAVACGFTLTLALRKAGPVHGSSP